MPKTIRYSLAAAALALALAPVARADLKSYNAAVLKGDFGGASNEIAATWAALDKSREDIFVIGREFGWTAMLAGKPVLARDVVGSLAQSKAVDPSPELTAVLLAWANFTVNGDAANRNRLFEALRTRAQKPQKDMISIRASQDLFRSEWNRDAMAGAAEAAALGHKVVAELGPETVDIQYTMRRLENVAKFIQRPDRKDFVAIRDLGEEIQTKLDTETDPRMRERLIQELAYSLSWQAVERKVLERQRVGVVDSKPLDSEGDKPWFPVEGDPTVPVCELKTDVNGKMPAYPKMALSKGLPGYAIYAFETQADGTFKSARLLGSAPHESFTETVNEVLPVWRWKMADGQAEGCRVPEQFVVHVDFVLKSR